MKSAKQQHARNLENALRVINEPRPAWDKFAREMAAPEQVFEEGNRLSRKEPKRPVQPSRKSQSKRKMPKHRLEVVAEKPTNDKRQEISKAFRKFLTNKGMNSLRLSKTEKLFKIWYRKMVMQLICNNKQTRRFSGMRSIETQTVDALDTYCPIEPTNREMDHPVERLDANERDLLMSCLRAWNVHVSQHTICEASLDNSRSMSWTTDDEGESELKQFLRSFYTKRVFLAAQAAQDKRGDFPVIAIPQNAEIPWKFTPEYCDLVVDVVAELTYDTYLADFTYESMLRHITMFFENARFNGNQTIISNLDCQYNRGMEVTKGEFFDNAVECIMATSLDFVLNL